MHPGASHRVVFSRRYRTGRDPVPEGMGKGKQICRSRVRPPSERKHRLIEAVETEGLIRCICKEFVLLFQ